MRLRHFLTPLFLFTCLTTSSIVASLASTSQPPAESAVASRDVTNANTPAPNANTAIPDAFTKGTLDAPVDGQDGMPHAGPWVKTNAERDRKNPSIGDVRDGKSTVQISSLAPEQLKPDGMLFAQSNNGVMGDLSRSRPKEGTRGIEGGVSERQKESTLSGEKIPGGPREVPPLPQSEQRSMSSVEHMSGRESKASEGSSGLGVLEKPVDLPDRPHDVPHPRSPGSTSEDPLGIQLPSAGKASLTTDTPELQPASGPFHSLLFSFTMIVFSEIGDKTFLAAALMAMRHPRLVVFSAASCALIGMTVLSALLGHAIPTLIPKTFTKFLAATLFLVFGLKMLKEGREMSPNDGTAEEMKEVEMELEEKEQEQLRMDRRHSQITPHSLEAGRIAPRQFRGSVNRVPSPPESVSSFTSRELSPSPRRRVSSFLAGLANLLSLLLSPAWVQTFAMTFLGEWGDRSQIATIAMAAGQDYWWVTVGAAAAHCLCTLVAVIGGSAIAGKVSMRAVTLGGAAMFLIFGVIYLAEAIF